MRYTVGVAGDRSDLDLGVPGLHRGGLSLKLPGVSSSLGGGGEVSRWGPPGGEALGFLVLLDRSGVQISWVLWGPPSWRGQGQAGVVWISCLAPPVPDSAGTEKPGRCPAHRPAHLLLLPDQRRGRQHLELALLSAPDYHRLLLHAQPGAGRALRVRASPLRAPLCLRARAGWWDWTRPGWCGGGGASLALVGCS